MAKSWIYICTQYPDSHYEMNDPGRAKWWKVLLRFAMPRCLFPTNVFGNDFEALQVLTLTQGGWVCGRLLFDDNI
jgi:hypothetical protein